MDIDIRRATLADIPWLADQLERFDQFFGAKRPIFDRSYTEDTFLPGLIMEHVVLVAERGHDRLGFIAGTLAPHAFNPAHTLLTELFWWVPVEHRGTRAGLMLLDAFTEIGRSKADWVSMSLEHDSPVRDQTILRRGFKIKERAFLMEVA